MSDVNVFLLLPLTLCVPRAETHVSRHQGYLKHLEGQALLAERGLSRVRRSLVHLFGFRAVSASFALSSPVCSAPQPPLLLLSRSIVCFYRCAARLVPLAGSAPPCTSCRRCGVGEGRPRVSLISPRCPSAAAPAVRGPLVPLHLPFRPVVGVNLRAPRPRFPPEAAPGSSRLLVKSNFLWF